MKTTKIILLFILILLSANSNAQKRYKPCLDGEITRWSLYHGMSSLEVVAYEDISIHNVSYKKLFMDHSFSFSLYRWEIEGDEPWKNHIPDFNRLSEFDSGNFLIRESEDASKLYLFDIEKNKEYLISDLDLEVGDLFEVPEFWTYSEDPVWIEVSSVYVNNGLKNVSLNLQNLAFSEKLIFTEGVGPNAGILPNYFFWRVEVICFQNSSFFYKTDNEIFFNCPCGEEVPSRIHYTESNKDYRINVDENNIKIQLSTQEDIRLSIYGTDGKVYYDKYIPAGEDVIIPRYSFPESIYILKVFYIDTNRTSTLKFII